MNNQEISAFAAYAAKKRKQKPEKNIVGFKIKNKTKLKKKKKKIFESNNPSLLNNFIKVTVPEISNNIGLKDKHKSNDKRELVKSLLKAKKENLFKDCNLTTKTDNIFLKPNSVEEENLNEIERKCSSSSSSKHEVKKARKKKVANGEREESKNVKNETKSEENWEDSWNEDEEMDYVYVKPNKIRKKMESLSKKLKMPDIVYSDSVKVGEEVLSWLLSPFSIKDFFEKCWEEKPLHIKRNNENYFKCVCSMEDFGTALRENDMYFTRNIDVTSYIDGERSTDNPEGKARPSVVWDLYKNGKSIRLLNPQTFIHNVRLLNSTLQEFFHCFVGGNVYLTPPGTQGFAPHYDDIEAFVLQLEGEKHWKLYNPRTPEEVLPRESSRNFGENEIGEPILEVTLKPGDLLYFPRGMIHQAKCLPHVHSLHITVSCYQKNSWADLLEKVLPVALQNAIAEDVDLRRGLPIGYLNHMGLVHSEKETELRTEMKKRFEELVQRVMEHCPLDAGIDQLGAAFVYDALPPHVGNDEKVFGADRDDRIVDKCLLDALKNYSDKSLSVKLIRATSVRLVSEEGEMYLYYTTDNSLVYHEQEACRVGVSVEWAQAIEYLIHSYPKFAKMKDLPVSNRMNKPGKSNRIAEFVYFLWQKGLLLFDRPLQQIYSE